MDYLTFLPAALYHPLYYIVIGILTLIMILRYQSLSPEENRLHGKSNQIPTITLAILCIIFIGLRPLSGVFVDMMNYNESYELQALNEHAMPHANNPGFNLFFDYYSLNDYPIVYFFFTIAVIYFGCMTFACIKLFKQDSFYAFLLFLGAFSTFTFGTNGIKSGAAASIFLVGLALHDKKWWGWLFMLISLNFHHSMIIPIGGYILGKYYNKPKIFMGFWIFCLICAALHIQYFQYLFNDLGNDKAAEYLSANENDWGGKTGFRIDFILYAFIPIVVGYWTIFIKGIQDKFYSSVFNLYLFTNAIWMLCMYVPYNNRIAYLSWSILPLVFSYPYFRFNLCDNQYIILNRISLLYIVFSIVAVFYL